MSADQEMVNIVVNDKPVEAKTGQTVLTACLQAGIYIPNLCHNEKDMVPAASCRLCFVQLNDGPDPVAACTQRVSDGLHIRTDTEAVRRLQRSALRLLLSVHCIECKTCPANQACALQQMARFLDMRLSSKPLDTILKTEAIDRSHPQIDYYPNRCVLCGKCIRVCRNKHEDALLTFYNRGFETSIRAFPTGKGLDGDCGNCARCIEVCPVAALQIRKE